ncbi:hypothetical protein RND81_13G171700 [Saponaria officinalis]|uniref:Reverse transcriptase zinc-binding domain-containing protein n=1 Tax=Saponaria officinalis TaxID=3572 RepID=A0AAW1H1M2_SAPOF
MFFSTWSGLCHNLSKTEIFFGGVRDCVKQAILDCTGFTQGVFPFRYLGVPQNTSRISVGMYGDLITKIQHAVLHWSSNLLTYAGLAHLINSISFGLETFWCASVLLPKNIIKHINKLCKNFFWSSGTQQRMIFKRWSSICKPWFEGGFEIKELLSWNKAQIAKLLWQIEAGQGGIWGKWIHKYVLGNQSIWLVRLSGSHSESFRNILSIRDSLLLSASTINQARGLLNSWASTGRFLVSKAYDMFRAKAVTRIWSKVITDRTVIPVHCITTTLARQRCLATIDKINLRGLVLINRCSLCKEARETHSHLFFKCSFSKNVWSQMLEWMKIMGCNQHWKTHWFRGALNVTVYYIWLERNTRIFEGKERDWRHIVGSIKYVVSIRCLYCEPKVE